jgi:peptide-methionine (S)-S-oxide reductase
MSALFPLRNIACVLSSEGTGLRSTPKFNRDDRTSTMSRLLPRSLIAALLVAAAWTLWTTLAVSGEAATAIPAPAVDAPAQQSAASETAVLAGGCFWGVQAVFQHVKGVTQAVSGYAGGTKESAQYETVSSGSTGHAESVAVTFDPRVVSYGTILQVYFSVAHNPTELNRQGPDTGTQYRSAIFARDEAQRRVAEAYIAQLDKAGMFHRPIVTEVKNMSGDATGDTGSFYPAEAYHQNYATRHPDNPYIAINDLPKVGNLKRLFPALYQDAPVLVSGAAPQG